MSLRRVKLNCAAHSASRYGMIEELVQLVCKGRLDISKSVSKTIPLSEINEGLAALNHKTVDPIRIVVTMSCRK